MTDLAEDIRKRLALFDQMIAAKRAAGVPETDPELQQLFRIRRMAEANLQKTTELLTAPPPTKRR